MSTLALASRRMVAIVAASLGVIILGYLYVSALGVGWRPAFVIHVGVLFLLGCALYMHDLRTFLLFALVMAIPLQFHYYVVYRPLLDVESQPFISGITIDTVDLILFGLYAYWIITWSMNKQISRITFGGWLGLFFALWVLWCLSVSLWKATAANYGLFEVIVLVKGYCIYFYLVNNVNSVRELKAVTYALFVGAVLHSLYMIGQYVTGLNYTLKGELFPLIRGTYEGRRAIGFFGSWDAASLMVALVFPILFAYYLQMTDPEKRMAALLSMAVCVVGALTVKVRAAYIAIFVSSLVLIFLGYFQNRVSMERAGRIFIAGGFLLVLASPFIIERFAAGTYGEDRVPLMATAMRMWEDNWLTGVGVNNFFMHIQQYVPVRYRYEWMYVVHNEYLLRLAETGVVGFAFYYLAQITAMVKSWRGCQSTDPWVYIVSLGIFCGLIGSLLPRLVSFYHYLNLYLLMVVIMALSAVVDRMQMEGELRRLRGETTA